MLVKATTWKHLVVDPFRYFFLKILFIRTQIKRLHLQITVTVEIAYVYLLISHISQSYSLSFGRPRCFSTRPLF